MARILMKTVLVYGTATLMAAEMPVVFETKTRVVAKGRDPMVAVRASGALSLMKVHKGDLWVHTSFDGGDSFEPPVRVNDIAGEVSTHGESSPQMQVRSRGEFYCLWQTRRGDGDVSALRLARSAGWGESFGKAIDVDASGKSASQSFFTMNVSPSGLVYAAWLDGRERGKGRPGTSALYLARSVNRGASFEPPVRVTLDVCPCCRPSIAFGSNQTVYISWRGVLDNQVRDIFVATSGDGGQTWSPGTRVAEDNWSLNGCPHSGAAMAVLKNRLFVSWHTVREKQPKLYLAYTDDGGQTFSRRHELSGAVIDPNHPFLQRTGETISLVFQGRDGKDKSGWGPIGVYHREVNAQAGLSPLTRLGQVAGSASYPTFAFEEPGRFYAAWTEPINDEHSIVLSRGRKVTTNGQ